MNKKRSTAWWRVATAYDVLRGRPPKPDFGILVLLPLIAAAGGSLIGLGVDHAVTRRGIGRNGATTKTPTTTGPVPVSS